LGGLFVQLDALPQLASDAIAQSVEMQQLAPGILATHPHGMLVVGAPFAGARVQIDIQDASQIVARWLEVLRESGSNGDGHDASLPVLFAGSDQDGQVLATAIEGRAQGVQQVDALSPSTLSPLTRATQQVYESAVLQQLPGYDQLRSLSAAPAVSTTTSLG